MKPSRRFTVNKGKSAGQFRQRIGKTKAGNMIMRGGLRA